MWLTGPVAPRHVGSSQTRARTRVPCIGRQILNHCATREAQFLLSCDCCDCCYCSFIVFTGRDLRCTPRGLMSIKLPPSGWLESSRGQNRISAVVSAAERKAFSNAGTNVKLSERETIQVGPCIALFPATTVYQFGSNQGRYITP